MISVEKLNEFFEKVNLGAAGAGDLQKKLASKCS